jgi:hypothetical protein
MKIIIIIFCLSLTGCGPDSSPEGRITNKMEEIRKEIDTLKQQNDALLDRVNKAGRELDSIRKKLAQ